MLEASGCCVRAIAPMFVDSKRICSCVCLICSSIVMPTTVGTDVAELEAALGGLVGGAATDFPKDAKKSSSAGIGDGDEEEPHALVRLPAASGAERGAARMEGVGSTYEGAA